MDSPLGSSTVPKSPLLTPNRRQRQQRERIKLFSQISLLNTTLESKIETILKIDGCPQVDDSSLILLSLPDGPTVSTSTPIGHTFHSFCITSQTGQRIYGGSYVFGYKNVINFDPNEQTDDNSTGVVYTTRALVALTVRPVVDQLHKCLEWCVLQADCNPRWIRCIAQIRLPPKGKCITIDLPNVRPHKKLSQKRSQELPQQEDSQLNGKPNAFSDQTTNVDNNNQIIIFRPLSTLPLFDYPLRRLFTEVLSVEQFMSAYICALNETKILIIGSNYYTLMLVAESLCALLNPFKWQHVYVPILPNKLGVHYLDAPTPYIMGINKSAAGLLSSKTVVGCLIDCDQNTVELNIDTSGLIVPPFVESLRQELEHIFKSDLRLNGSSSARPQSAALKRMTDLAKKHNVINEWFGYSDDLKLNQQIRVTFLKTIRKHILNKYQQFIITSNNKKDSIRFDAVAYLSDQPQSMQPFLQQFCETQMFVTFIDETGKQLARKQRSMMNSTSALVFDSIYDDDFEDLDLSLFTDVILESRIAGAKRMDLSELEDFPAQEGLTVCSDRAQLAASAVSTSVMASPRTRRRFPSLSDKSSTKDLPLGSGLASPMRTLPAALTAQTNWRVVETLMREVKIKTKRILLEKMGTEEVGPLGCGTVGGVEENTLIAALCDLIERIWSHARSDDNQDMIRWQSGKCSFWSHLMAYYQLVTNEDVGAGTQKSAIDSSQLTPGLAWILFRKRIDSLTQLSIDSSSTASQSTPSPKHRDPMKPLPTTLIYDIRSVRSMADIKTDVGKSRALIRLALERKLLSKHLRTLLSNNELLLTLYKRYAFLRCEEEREQFLTHLLTLNAVDLMCFTNTFTTSVLPYTLIICGSTQLNGWFSITGSIASTCDNYSVNEKNCYTFKHRNFGFINTLTVCVNQSSKIYIEYCFLRNEVTNHIFKFSCNRWFGRNIDDGSTERVLIGQLLTGTSVNEVLKKSGASHPTRSSSIGRHWSRASDQYNNGRDVNFSVEELQTMFGENVNQIMKYYFSANNTSNTVGADGTGSTSGSHSNNSQLNGHKIVNNYENRSQIHCKTVGAKAKHQGYGTGRRSMNRSDGRSSGQSLINIIFGERKLLWILTQIFYYGFKNRSRMLSSLRKQYYLWDYLLRIVCELKISRTTHKTVDANEEVFISLVDSITDCAPNYGKDSKFALFLLLSIRDHHLSPAFLRLLSKPSLSHLYYENQSFIRDITLMTFLYQILNTFNDIELTFDPSLTKGL